MTLEGCDSINQAAGDEQMDQLICTITNPNSFAVDVEISFVSRLNLPALLLSQEYIFKQMGKSSLLELDLLEDVDSLSDETGNFVVRMTTISKDDSSLTSTEISSYRL